MTPPTTRFHSPEDRARAVSWYAEGSSARTVGIKVGTTTSTVLRWVRAAGVEVRARGRARGDYSPAVQLAARRMRRGGASWLKICQAIHADRRAVQGWCSEEERRPLPQARTEGDASVAQAYSDGATLRELAREHGASLSTAKKWIVLAGGEMRRRGRIRQ